MVKRCCLSPLRVSLNGSRDRTRPALWLVRSEDEVDNALEMDVWLSRNSGRELKSSVDV